MAFKLIIILLGLSLTGLVVGRCPEPETLPYKVNTNKFLCARLYDYGHRDKLLSCTGASWDVLNGETYPGRGCDGWNDRVSALVVRPGCTLTAYVHGQFSGPIMKYTGSKPHLGGWDNYMSSWSCSCPYTDAPLNCVPLDRVTAMKTCDNTKGDKMECVYSVQKGMVLGRSVTHGRSVSTSVEASIGAVFKEIFSVGMSVSHTTTHDWSSSQSEEFSRVVTHTVTCGIPIGRRLAVKQVVGVCGDTKVYSNEYRCELLTGDNEERVIDEKTWTDVTDEEANLTNDMPE
ncbi:uncharacterized protein LOC121426810 [Lytechinus variegatus]|uniref:uncharacterized protein LOC121426810 n=1 Tax=Lytechinus variegatus TaxID=7654 RepID=UPI001BB22915|nr:uncharacterized protein LOC121426810 [Lytechinus variegatus]